MEVRLLGALEAAGEAGTPLSVQGAKLRALLAMLALDAGRVVPTDRLIDGLWQDDPPAGVANSLQRLVSKLRKALGSGEVVAMRPPGYVLVVDADDVDVHRFERLVREARDLAAQGRASEAIERFSAAEALWRGPALADFAYEEFARPPIARLDELHLSAIEDRVELELAQGRHQHLVPALDALVAEHPTRERVRGQLMLALYRCGRQSDALRVLQEGRSALAEEQGLLPGPDLQALEHAILDHDPALAAPAAAPARSIVPPPTGRTSLRAALGPLVGRARELDEIAGLLASHRLVTIVGPGGAGKTRLALETAQRRLARGGDVVVVELAGVADPTGVPAAVASAFDLPDPSVDDPITRVSERCAGRDVLLVLDNCEHLVDGAAAAADRLLSLAGSLRLLTTSREALRVAGEAVWVAPPLAPTEACQLFVDRARAADSTFEPSAADLTVVAEVCERLDGLPLAIELAAARTRAFTVAQIAERLDDRFRLLTGGSRTAMARQQTLRAVVDWSYDLLFDDERRVFERLSVFTGGCTATAAEVVCADGLEPGDVDECIVGLVDKSLLTVDRSGAEARYGMLQTLSQYGRERLVERGDADATFGRMAAHLAAICAGGREAWRGVRQREWFRAVHDERDNIRTAFEWAHGVEDKALATSLAADVAFARWVGGGTADGRAWLDRARRLPGDPDDFTQGWAQMWFAFLSFVTGHRERFEADFAEALERLRSSADPVFVAYALSFESQLIDATGRRARSIELNHALLDALAATTDPWARPATLWAQAALAIQERGDFVAYEARLREAADAYRDVGDQFMFAVCRDLVAELAETRGDLAEVRADLAAALRIVSDWGMRSFEAALTARLARAAVQGLDDDAEVVAVDALSRCDDVVFRPGQALALNTLADLRRRQGRLDEAEAAAADALDRYRGAPALRYSSSFSRAPTMFDVPVGEATSLSVLGFCAEARGDAAVAIDRHRSAFEVVAPTGHPRAIALALDGLAAAAALGGDARWCGQLLGCSDHLRRASDARRTPAEQDDADRAELSAVAEIGLGAFQAALEVGDRVPADQLLGGPQTG